VSAGFMKSLSERIAEDTPEMREAWEAAFTRAESLADRCTRKFMVEPRKAGKKPKSTGTLTALVAALRRDIVGHRLRFAELYQELDTLRAELAAAKWTHRGAWDATKTYPLNSTVQHGGSCWLRIGEATNDRPGSGSPEMSGWALVAKGGRDGDRRTVRVPSRGSAISDPRGGER
jgi:hypothetical protein